MLRQRQDPPATSLWIVSGSLESVCRLASHKSLNHPEDLRATFDVKPRSSGCVLYSSRCLAHRAAKEPHSLQLQTERVAEKKILANGLVSFLFYKAPLGSPCHLQLPRCWASLIASGGAWVTSCTLTNASTCPFSLCFAVPQDTHDSLLTPRGFL